MQQQYKCKYNFFLKSENTQDLHIIFMAIKTCTQNIGLDMGNLIFYFEKWQRISKYTNKNSFFHFMKTLFAPKKHQWALGMF